jgi:hypothetical protein
MNNHWQLPNPLLDQSLDQLLDQIYNKLSTQRNPTLPAKLA